ncbi:MAG TPA: ABC transporter permease [Candidatus Sulfotelmatobacter sp.]
MMSTQSNAIPQSALASGAGNCNEISIARRFYWSVKREVWESRSIYIAPLAVAAVIFLGFFVSAIHLPAKVRDASGMTPLQQGDVFVQPYDLAALALMAATLVVAAFYCLDALHGERRDRSILFWKSLPISDRMTVLSKATIPLLLLPLITFLITVALHVAMLLLSAVILLLSGPSLAMLSHLRLGIRWIGLLDHLVFGHGLYYAPFYGWFLLVSAWARRATFLWAVLPPLAVGVLEKILFNTSHFADLIGDRFGIGGSNSKATGMFAMVTEGPDLSSPGLWIGLLLTVMFLFVAVQLRRRQGPV